MKQLKPRLFLRDCALTALISLLPITPAVAQSFPYHSCYLESTGKKPIFARLQYLRRVPNFSTAEWIVYVPQPPELPGQSKVSSGLIVDNHSQGNSVRELSRQQRTVLGARIGVSDARLKNELPLVCNYWLTLEGRHLVSGTPASLIVVTPLSASEACQFTEPSETLDFTSPSFRGWLSTQGLHCQQSESDLDFAWRAFLKIRSLYSYNYSKEQDRHVSKVSQASSTDCGGISWLYEATLRANGIPARSLIGRWATSDTGKMESYGQCHVKSEFYAKGVGWVPVEMSGAISYKSSDPMNFFGQDRGDFVTFHVDPDLVLETYRFGQKPLRNLQGPVVWVFGYDGSLAGLTDQITWQVQQIAPYR